MCSFIENLIDINNNNKLGFYSCGYHFHITSDIFIPDITLLFSAVPAGSTLFTGGDLLLQVSKNSSLSHFSVDIIG